MSDVLRRVIRAIADDGDVMCGCADSCEHVPVLEEIVLPPSRPRQVGVTALDRHGLVAMARRRGILAVIVPAAR
jgi:hypothetical protein